MPHSPLDKTYNADEVESRWGRHWIEHNLFQPKGGPSGPHFSIVIPPPNVTGSLHIGHALNNTLQDILIRWRRMQGFRTRWIPGTDHAGIATQNVVERQLMQEGTTREALGREAFIQRIWEWRKQSGDTIISQLKQLGASCDWSRVFFTMDQDLSVAVREVFVRLFEEGLIYRGERLINWCPRCLTALSDIEVEHEQAKGKLYHIRYPLAGNPEHLLIVATTRPETLLGDTAVAVHPEDPRHQHLIGQCVTLPLTSRTIPIVGDSIVVDREFGTGAVKITPAHDFNDFEAGQRHGLDQLPLLDYHGRMNTSRLQQAKVDATLIQALSGKTAVEARPIVNKILEEKGLLLQTEDHQLAIGKCYRCKSTVEPYLSPQWFVKIQPLADPAIEAVETGTIRILPEGWKNNYLGWMRQIKDWCISRQIWWGHQIPAWYCRTCNKNHLLEGRPIESSPQETGLSPDAGTMSCLISKEAVPLVSQTPPSACPKCGGTSFLQDPDVLDTWFSSSLWPFSTLGWPEDTEDLKTFYPTSTLVTGLDILFFWVARMIMMGLKFTGQVPFRDVYIHALVRDAEGQKMSKSKGNVIDPLTKMHQYGTDALRFTLASMASPGRDIKLAEERIEGYRNFVTKIWNAARFIQLHTPYPVEKTNPLSSRSFPDRWIFSRLNHTIREVTHSLENYRFDQATSSLYRFLWHEYCDWYIELTKTHLQDSGHPDAHSTRQSMLESFEIIQRLLHPFMPFLTEELWQTFPHEGPSIVIQPFPKENQAWTDPETEAAFDTLQTFITTARTARALLNLSPAQIPLVYGTSTSDKELRLLTDFKPYFESLFRSPVEFGNEIIPHAHTLQLPSGAFNTMGIQIPDQIDRQQVVNKIQKQIGEKEKELHRLTNRLTSPDFKTKAEPSVIQESEGRCAKLKDELAILTITQQQLTSMSS
jgi:valyl-tRNA synthetase